MTWVAVGATAVTVIGGAIASDNAADQAADASRNATNSTIAEQRRQYDQSRKDMLPWLNAGGDALAQLQALNSGDFSSFKESPDYQFAFGQGLQALDRSAAARGGLFSGGADADRIAYGQGMAAQQYGNYYNRLASMAGLGQTTASGLGTLGANMAGQIGAAYQNNAANQRQSAYDTAETWRTGLAGLAGAFGRGYQRNSALNDGGTGWYLGSNPGVG